MGRINLINRYNFKLVLLSIFILLQFFSVSISQNLVPDSSFENNNSCPSNLGELNKLKDWKSPTKGTPDYFNKCTQWGRYCAGGAYNYDDINVFPNSGNGLVSLAIRDNNTEAYREYLQAKLLKPLGKNKKYLVSFYVWTESVYYPDRLGATFTVEAISDYKNYVLNSKNVINLKIDSVLIKDNSKYLKISEIYSAKGGENYITIGHFSNETKFFISKPSSYNAIITSLYIDDVSVIEINESELMEKFELGKSLRLNHIYFETNSSNILPESVYELSVIVEILRNNPNYKIEISGHTDNVGDFDYNKKLSLARAEAIAEYLKSKSISKTRITSKGLGDSKPIAANDTEENKAKNRRVEVVFKK